MLNARPAYVSVQHLRVLFEPKPLHTVKKYVEAGDDVFHDSSSYFSLLPRDVWEQVRFPRSPTFRRFLSPAGCRLRTAGTTPIRRRLTATGRPTCFRMECGALSMHRMHGVCKNAIFVL